MKYKSFGFNNAFVTFTVAIEKNLYEKEYESFSMLFMNFDDEPNPHNCECYYVFEGNAKISNNIKNVILVDLNNPIWLYDFFIEIDNIINKSASISTVCFHSSGIVTQFGAIVFIGKRNIGKSTIIKKLMAASLYSYLDDDIIMVKDGMVWGPGLPIKSRIRDSSCELEWDGEMRYLTNHHKVNNQPQKLIAIVYPTFNKQGENYLEILSSRQCFRNLYDNIKHGDMAESIKMAVDMSININSYRMDYSSDEFLYSSIESIILREKETR